MDSVFELLQPDATFCFYCSPAVPCFNQCCRDLNQILMPYDILRLRQCLNMDSGIFLAQYTIMRMGPATGLPTVSLRPDTADDLKCPFVTPSGCRVYPDRPASCRTYPLARAIHRNRKTGKTIEHYGLIKENHCRGLEQKKTVSIKEWINDQEIKEYNRMNDLMIDIISLKNRMVPGPLDPTAQHMFAGALYNIDGFRTEFLSNNHIASTLKLTRDQVRSAESDDTVLLNIGMKWVKYYLTNINDWSDGNG